MGICTTRPSDSESYEHTAHENHSNDHKFITLPSMQIPDLDTNNFEALALQLRQVRLKLSQIQTRQDDFARRTLRIPWTIIEVRKGKDIQADENCFRRANLFVTVRLNPDGPAFETGRSSSVLPKWYRLFQLHHYIEGFTDIEFTVIAEYNGILRTQFGKCFINFSSLMSQQTIQEWLPLTRPLMCEGHPELEVKIQVIYDEMRLLKFQAEICEGLICKLQEMLEKDHKSVLS